MGSINWYQPALDVQQNVPLKGSAINGLRNIENNFMCQLYWLFSHFSFNFLWELCEIRGKTEVEGGFIVTQFKRRFLFYIKKIFKIITLVLVGSELVYQWEWGFGFDASHQRLWSILIQRAEGLHYNYVFDNLILNCICNNL